MTHPLQCLTTLVLFLCLSATAATAATAPRPLHERVKHAEADSNGVKIHYVTIGKGPLVVMIHGFPDFWYTWRHQMEALAEDYQVVALDMRGYNRSDKPKGVEQYSINLLVGDVAAVIKHAGAKQATIVGHDWGGMVAWQFAMALPGQCSRLIILNLPHPRGLSRELANNPQQQKNSAYARAFQLAGAHRMLSAEGLSRWVRDKAARARYVEAFKRSDFEAMLNYYKRNYPRLPYKEDTSPVVKVKAPVLMFHGLNDRALLPGALNDTWQWVEKDLTLVTVPGSGHFVQQDAAELVSRTMKMWLDLKNRPESTPAR
jgi:pimeloyl-ACP methyl ester carboxylesterase